MAATNRTTFMALGVGIGIGEMIVLVCVGIFVFLCTRRKGKPLETEEFGYAPPKGLKGDPCAPPSTINVVKIPNLIPLIILPNTHQSTMDVSTSLNSSEAIPQTDPQATFNTTKNTFTYEELALAMDNFSTTNLLGQGGFGYVHKGVLHDGRDVAIKQLKVGSGQGEREFQAEVEMISRVHHNHLVLLFGYCISGTRRLLVHDYCTEMARMVAWASGCIRHLARRRPKINQIIRALEGKLPLHELDGIQSNTRNNSNESSDCDSLYDTVQYREDLIKFKKMALETRPSGSSSDKIAH